MKKWKTEPSSRLLHTYKNKAQLQTFRVNYNRVPSTRNTIPTTTIKSSGNRFPGVSNKAKTKKKERSILRKRSESDLHRFCFFFTHNIRKLSDKPKYQLTRHKYHFSRTKSTHNLLSLQSLLLFQPSSIYWLISSLSLSLFLNGLLYSNLIVKKKQEKEKAPYIIHYIKFQSSIFSLVKRTFISILYSLQRLYGMQNLRPPPHRTRKHSLSKKNVGK